MTALQATIERLQAGYGCLTACHTSSEWQQIASGMLLQYEGDKVYAAVLSTPGFELLDCEQNATQAGDWYFEDWRWFMYDNGRLWL